MLRQVEFHAFRPVVQLLRTLAKSSDRFQSIVSRSFGDVAKKPLKMSQTMPMAMPMSMPMSMSLYPNNQQSGSLACCLSQANASPLASSILVMCKHADSILPEYKKQQMQRSMPIYQCSTRMDSYNQQYYHHNYDNYYEKQQRKQQKQLPEQFYQLEQLEKLSRLVRKTENLPFKQLEEKSPRQSEETNPEIPTTPPTRPMYNPLSRRHTVDRARLQYINEMFKELANEVELRKPKAKKFVSRSSLHSGRNDKID